MKSEKKGQVWALLVGCVSISVPPGVAREIAANVLEQFPSLVPEASKPASVPDVELAEAGWKFHRNEDGAEYWYNLADGRVVLTADEARAALIPSMDEQEAFEKWGNEQWSGRNIPHNAWLGWQARAALQPQPLTAMEREKLVEMLRTEVQSFPISIKPDKQFRRMARESQRPISAYHNAESAREVAEAVLSAIEQNHKVGKS